MSGRAGRRGLDQSGHAIVHGPAPWSMEKKNVISQSLLTYSKIYVVMLFSAFQKKTTENSWLFFWKLLRHM